MAMPMLDQPDQYVWDQIVVIPLKVVYNHQIYFIDVVMGQLIFENI